MTFPPPTAAVYSFDSPGNDVVLHTGRMTVDGHQGSGQVWMQTAGGLDFRWQVQTDDYRPLKRRDVQLAFVHPVLGAVDVPARVTDSDGRGVLLDPQVGSASDLDRVVVHWVNLPKIAPEDVLQTLRATWVGRWYGSGGGWSLVLDSRWDHQATENAAKGTANYVLTHTAALTRTNGAPFSVDDAVDALYAWQTALSFALGRWVAPALAVGFRADARVWELWSSWRCDPYRGQDAWWDPDQGQDLKDFVELFLNAWADPNRHDQTRYVAHHVIASNEQRMTLEARVMLVGAALEYLSWVRQVIAGRRPAKEHGKRAASQNLRELLTEATISPAVPADLADLEQIRVTKSLQDAPEAAAWLRNRLVHPKDAGEPYRLRHLVLQVWQLLMEYAELLLLHDLGYEGSFRRRYPPGRWAHTNHPVPWATPPGTAPAGASASPTAQPPPAPQAPPP